MVNYALFDAKKLDEVVLTKSFEDMLSYVIKTYNTSKDYFINSYNEYYSNAHKENSIVVEAKTTNNEYHLRIMEIDEYKKYTCVLMHEKIGRYAVAFDDKCDADMFLLVLVGRSFHQDGVIQTKEIGKAKYYTSKDGSVVYGFITECKLI